MTLRYLTVLHDHATGLHIENVLPNHRTPRHQSIYATKLH